MQYFSTLVALALMKAFRGGCQAKLKPRFELGAELQQALRVNPQSCFEQIIFSCSLNMLLFFAFVTLSCSPIVLK